MKSLIWTAFLLLALPGTALAQAAVEGALTHGLSGTASAGAAKALGQIGNQLAGRMGQQTSNAGRPAVTTARTGYQKVGKLPQTVTPLPSAAGGSMIASIQGGEPQQAEAKCPAEPEVKSPQQAPKQTACSAAKPSAEQTAHPSEITLPAAKQ